MISDEYFNQETPPVLWVITRERARAGKPPFKIIPFNWVRTGISGDPWAVSANRTESRPDGRIYPLSSCFISSQAARNHLSRIIDEEIAFERSKFYAVKNKLSLAMNAARKIVD